MLQYQDYTNMVHSKFKFLLDREEVNEKSPIPSIIGYIEIMNQYKEEVNKLLTRVTRGGEDFYKEDMSQILSDVIYVDNELLKFNNLILQKFIRRDYPLIIQ